MNLSRTPILYIITGLPYAGKTSLRNKLVSRFGFSVISVDEIMDQLGMWDSPRPTDNDWTEAYRVAYKQLQELLSKGKDTIFDGGSLKKSERETQRSIARQAKARYKLIYVSTPMSVIIERKLKNRITRERSQVDDEIMKTAFDIWEEPAMEEEPIIYTSEENLDEWVDKYIR